MLHILFVILKILAIIIASILGLLLFLLLIVLFVPIRYRADLRKNNEIVVKARVNWLLRIVFARIWFINQQLHLRLRVFGICIYDNLRPKKEKKPKKSSPNLKEKRVKKKETKEAVMQKIETQVEETKTQVEETKTQIEDTKGQIEVSKTRIEFSPKSKVPPDAEKEKLVDLKITQTIAQTTIPLEGREATDAIEDQQISSEEEKGHRLGRKIKSIVANIKAKLKSLHEILKGLWEKKNKIIAFLKNEINKAGIKMALSQVFKILKHCAPKKISGYIRYGTGDPCSTGEAFAVAAFFYGKYGNSLKLVPDFEEEVLEAEVMVKGRIRIFSLLIIGIKLIRDKNFSKLLKNARQLKEEL